MTTDTLITRLILLATLLLPTYLLRFSILGVPTNVVELLVAGAFLLWLWTHGRTFDWAGLWKAYQLLCISIALLLLGVGGSTLASGAYEAGLGVLLGWFIAPMIYAFLTLVQSQRDPKLPMTLLQTYYASAVIVAIIALSYLITGNLTYDSRLTAFYLSPNHLAMYLAPALAGGLVLLLHGKAWKSLGAQESITSTGQTEAPSQASRMQLIAFIATLLLLAGILYATNSYSAWLAVLGSLVLVVIMKKGLTWKVFTVGIIAVVVLALSQLGSSKVTDLLTIPERSSLASRLMIYEAALAIGKDHAVFGIGPNQFQAAYLTYQPQFPSYLEWAVPQPHNLLLAFWLQAGLAGLLGFLLLIAWWLKEVFPRVKRGNVIALIAYTILLYTLLHGLLDTPYWKNDLAFLFWLVIAVGMITKKKAPA